MLLFALHVPLFGYSDSFKTDSRFKPEMIEYASRASGYPFGHLDTLVGVSPSPGPSALRPVNTPDGVALCFA